MECPKSSDGTIHNYCVEGCPFDQARGYKRLIFAILKICCKLRILGSFVKMILLF